MKCGNCGQNITNDDAFCPNCGSKLVRNETNNTNKTFGIGKAFLISFITAILVFLIPVIVNIICGIGNVTLNETFKIFLSIIQFICPILTLFIMPIVLYVTKSQKNT